MLTAVSGYYDGAHIVLDENDSMQIGQKVIITLDAGPASTPKNRSILANSWEEEQRCFRPMQANL